MAGPSLDIPRDEYETAWKIANRAADIARESSISAQPLDFAMDIVATHANGCPLRLEDLLDANDVDFIHDVFGINRHIDRGTGQLQDCFVPRYAMPEIE